MVQPCPEAYRFQVRTVMSQKRRSPAIISPWVHDCQAPGTSSSWELPWGLVPQRLKLPQDNSYLMGIFAAQALIQSKIVDPGQVFLLLFYLCLLLILFTKEFTCVSHEMFSTITWPVWNSNRHVSWQILNLSVFPGVSLGDLGDLGHGALEAVSSLSSPSPWTAGQCQRRPY